MSDQDRRDPSYWRAGAEIELLASENRRTPEAKANARLIAAVDDLYAALHAMLEEAEIAAKIRGGEGHMEEVMAGARAALARARGEEAGRA